MTNLNCHIGVIGLGYVGLPLALEFSKKFRVSGYDINPTRIAQLCSRIDSTNEADAAELASARAHFTSDPADLDDCNIYIVTVPTPVNEHKQPDFRPLLDATAMIGERLSVGDIVIYESTVYPGATEELCVPALERTSGLKFNVDFSVGYSPERINPGDKTRRLRDIPKVTSGSNTLAASKVDELYRAIITAGTHCAPTIKVAEAAKVIENTQRDVNIALMNEFSLIFERLNIDTTEVLAAAGTKWNFMPFRPGLVGGHCIGVDPYYLIQRAQSVGYYPDILLACRRINDAMGDHVASQIVKLLIARRIHVADARILVLGMTFKEDCPDIRNSRVADLVHSLKNFGPTVDVYDPWADPLETAHEYGIQLVKDPARGDYDAVVLAVAHATFKDPRKFDARAFGRPGAVVYDVKGALPRDQVDGRL